MNQQKNRAINQSIAFGHTLLDEIDEAASLLFCSRSQFVRDACRERLRQLRASGELPPVQPVQKAS